MIIFNTTYHTNHESVDAFVNWLRTSYIPKAVESGVLTKPQLTLIMTDDEKAEGKSYSLQFHAESMETLEEWYKSDGIKLVEELESQFQQNVAGFSTLMHLLDI